MVQVKDELVTHRGKTPSNKRGGIPLTPNIKN